MLWSNRCDVSLLLTYNKTGDCDNIRVFVRDEQLHPVGRDDPNASMPVMSNIVYSEVLLH